MTLHLQYVLIFIDVVGRIGCGSRETGTRHRGPAESEQKDSQGRAGVQQLVEAGRRHQHRLQEMKPRQYIRVSPE